MLVIKPADNTPIGALYPHLYIKIPAYGGREEIESGSGVNCKVRLNHFQSMISYVGGSGIL